MKTVDGKTSEKCDNFIADSALIYLNVMVISAAVTVKELGNLKVKTNPIHVYKEMVLILQLVLCRNLMHCR